ncbi:MAG: TrkA family potassium uptake protein [Actinomycetota bacterium]
MVDKNSGRLGSRRHGPRLDVGEPVVVVGLGRFGGAVAAELMRLGFEVLGIDGDAERVAYYADMLTHVVQADSTNENTLRQLGCDEFRHAVVGIGSVLEASILTTAALADMGVPNIWAKAVSRPHGRILERVGAHHVINPEHDMGHRVAHLVGGRMIDWFQLDEDFAMVETAVPKGLVGPTLAELEIRARHGVTVVCVKQPGEGFTYATPDTRFQEGSVLVVAGPSRRASEFAHLD